MRLLVLAWWFLLAAPAFAQPAPALTPPVAQSSTDVPYPEGAEGDASVLVELVVEKDGTVSEAAVIEGPEAFAEPARRAVLTWRFVPARRGEEPVRARIRARVEFRREPTVPAPSVKPAPAPARPASPALVPPPPPPEAIQEVTVHGERPDIGQTTLLATDVREMPGAFGDAFRAVEALPGVAPLLSGVPYFFVRGAPPNNNGYFLDGVRVPLLFHVALGPGVVHPGLIERIDFYPGAAPARYGGVAGAIIAGTTRAPASSFHGEANLRLVDAGALIEAPFAAGQGSALVAGRYGYPGPIVGLFSDVNLSYWDYQGRLTWRAGERDTLGLFAFGSHDYLGHREPTGEENEDFVSDFHRVDLRYDRAFTAGSLRVAATLGHDSQGSNPTYLTNRSAALRVELEQRLAENLRLRAGADVRLDAYGFRQGASEDPDESVVPSNADPPPTNVSGGVHADVVWRVIPRVELVPGIRVGVFASSRRSTTPGEGRVETTIAAVDPRFAARVTLARRLAWLSTFGLAHQYPSLRVGEVPAPFVTGSGFPPGNRQLQSSLQLTQGFELALPADLVLTTTGFLTRTEGLTDLTASCVQIDPPTFAVTPGEPPPLRPHYCPNNAPVPARSYGVELLLRRPLTKRLSGWLSYTLSRSTLEGHFVTLEGGEAVATVASGFDRTHVLNAVLAYDLGRRWRAGSRFVFYTGVPYSKLSGSVPVPPYNSLRDPPFYRLDVRLEKRWPLGRDGSIAFVLEGQNVTLSRETSTLGMDCRGVITPDGVGTTQCVREKIGPITIPSIGVEAFF